MTSSSAISIDYTALATALIACGFGQGGATSVVGGGVEVTQVGAPGGEPVVVEAHAGAGGKPVVGACGDAVTLAGASAPKAQVDQVLVIDDSTQPSSDCSGSEASESSVHLGAQVPVVPQRVRDAVNFGGFADVEKAVTRSDGGGFFGTVVRGSNVKSLKTLLQQYSAAKLPKAAMVDLAICAHTAGVMPVAIQDGKARLRSLASIGDAAITMHLVVHEYNAGRNVESAQAARSRKTSNASFCAALRKFGFMQHVMYAPGVDPSTSVASATAFEALVGVLAMYRPVEVVHRFLYATELLE